jgi:hypothetical protein
LNVAGLAAVSYLLDMHCIANSDFFKADSDISLPGGDNVIFRCNFNDEYNQKRTHEIPVKFIKQTADAISKAITHNSVARKAFAAAFCAAASLKKNVEVTIEMYIRIITSDEDNLSSGLFMRSAADLRSKEAADAVAEAARAAKEEAEAEKEQEEEKGKNKRKIKGN